MAMGSPFLPLSICFFASCSHLLFCVGEDRLLPGGAISGNKTITSSGGTFALGFFSPGNSTGKSYIGIWYKSIPVRTVVWVANREAPLEGPTGALTVMADGNIALLDGKGSALWSTNLSGIHGDTSAVLLDSGNFVLRDRRGSDLWQSFEHPTDTCLPTQQLQLDFKTGEGRKLVSWRDPQDPSPGEYSLGFDPRSRVQAIMWKGSTVRWRGFPWSAAQVMGGRYSNSSSSFREYAIVDERGISVMYTTTGILSLSRYVLDPSGKVSFLYWNHRTTNWCQVASHPSDPCELYEPCGAFGYCVLDGAVPVCRCLLGFEAGNFSGGCVRRRPLGSDGKDGFLRSDAMKLPDNFVVRWNTSAAQCEAGCLEDGRCTAYAFADVSGGATEGCLGSRCLVWTGELVDLARLVDAGEDLYVRVAASELGALAQKAVTSKKTILPKIIIPTVALGMLLMGASFCFLRRKLSTQARTSRKGLLLDTTKLSESFGSENDMSELILLDFNSIIAATNNFSMKNRLGQGGFGHVYKGKLFQCHEVAIKRLYKCSGQGIEEFTNEVRLIAKLQHKNLVRLLGWCNHEEEKILVYDYMPHGSLDKFIFDPIKSANLDWKKRLTIIEGIANGLLYLHEHSRLRVIHRDLKTSNILLDASMNPKISDFGLARIFGENQIEANTERVVGTFGYMSPEYALDGLFSEKSDVFSFGVMLLEIITGRRTTGFYPYKESISLIGFVWQLWKEGQSLQLVDPSISNLFSVAEVAKCIQIGLLCIQDNVADRPSMSSIVFMLRNENTALSSPKQPAFAVKQSLGPQLATTTSNATHEHGSE